MNSTKINLETLKQFECVTLRINDTSVLELSLNNDNELTININNNNVNVNNKSCVKNTNNNTPIFHQIKKHNG